MSLSSQHLFRTGIDKYVLHKSIVSISIANRTRQTSSRATSIENGYIKLQFILARAQKVRLGIDCVKSCVSNDLGAGDKEGMKGNEIVRCKVVVPKSRLVSF